MDSARTCNCKVGQFPIDTEWQDVPLLLQSLAEVILKNIQLELKIFQRVYKYLNSSKKLLKSMTFMLVEMLQKSKFLLYVSHLC